MKIVDILKQSTHLNYNSILNIINYIANYSHAQIIANNNLELSPTQYQQYLSVLSRLKLNEPLSYILGFKDFYNHRFYIDNSVLIPRADSEILVEFAIKTSKEMLANNNPHSQKHFRVLELGTGSGCIAISIDKELQKIANNNYQAVEVIATDISIDALNIASYNAKLLSSQVQFINSNWFSNIKKTDNLSEKFDLIISNPPYIAADDPHLVNLTYEPRIALTDELDGLSHITAIANEASSFLKPSATIAIEHGYNQQRAVAKILKQANFQNCGCLHDYGNNPRVSYGKSHR